MDTYLTEAISEQHRNPWRAFVPHWSVEGYEDPPTDSLTLQNAQSAWKRMFGDRQVTLGVQDPVPFQQGTFLGSGGLGAVYETEIDGVAVAWKRTYSRRLTNWHHNEVKILGQMTEERHKHIVKLVGSYIHRQRNGYELAILTWPVARCDLSIVLREIDLINEWMGRDQPWDEHDRSVAPTTEEKAAYDNLLKLEHLDQERSRTFTWHLRDKVRIATLQRLKRSIGCIAEAVKYLHNHRIRHKDIKPSQILLSPDGLWLTDFGFSTDSSLLTSSETSGGDKITPRYHAPERAHMGKCGTPEDIFALGCTFLEMGYRIYCKNHEFYLNPKGTPRWSFHDNLDLIDTWLTPFGSNAGASSWLGHVIRSMLQRDPYTRPSIEGVIAGLIWYTGDGEVAFFGLCCQQPAHRSSLTDAATNTGEMASEQGRDIQKESGQEDGKENGTPDWERYFHGHEQGSSETEHSLRKIGLSQATERSTSDRLESDTRPLLATKTPDLHQGEMDTVDEEDESGFDEELPTTDDVITNSAYGFQHLSGDSSPSSVFPELEELRLKYPKSWLLRTEAKLLERALQEREHSSLNREERRREEEEAANELTSEHQGQQRLYREYDPSIERLFEEHQRRLRQFEAPLI